MGAAALALKPRDGLGSESRGTVRRVTGRCVTELRHPPRAAVSPARGGRLKSGGRARADPWGGGSQPRAAWGDTSDRTPSRSVRCCRRRVAVRAVSLRETQPAPRTLQPTLCPANPTGALAIRSGDQDGLNVMVVIDQQRLDRSDRPMRAGSEILRQRLPMREGLPLEGDGPAPGCEGTLDIAIVPGEQRDQRRSRLSHERRQMVGQRGAARELLALIHDRKPRASYHGCGLSREGTTKSVCGFRRSRPGIPNVFRAPFQSDAAHQSNLMAPRMVSSRRPVPVMS
jgi:hypothetical protein